MHAGASFSVKLNPKYELSVSKYFIMEAFECKEDVKEDLVLFEILAKTKYDRREKKRRYYI